MSQDDERSVWPTSAGGWVLLAVLIIVAVWFFGGMISAAFG
jgi:hypothetical protein